jgi:uncharacterized protein (DUF433 family)
VSGGDPPDLSRATRKGVTEAREVQVLRLDRKSGCGKLGALWGLFLVSTSRESTAREHDTLPAHTLFFLETSHRRLSAERSASVLGAFTGVMLLVQSDRTLLMRFERITIDRAVATGKPCIRNLRFPVSRLLGLLAARESRESILHAYPYLEAADIDEALGYAAYLRKMRLSI